MFIKCLNQSLFGELLGRHQDSLNAEISS